MADPAPPPPLPADWAVLCDRIVADLLHHGLSSSATWCAETLPALAPTLAATDKAAVPPNYASMMDASSGGAASHAPTTASVLLARTLLPRQEYRRVIAVLANDDSDEACFLRHYCTYLDGEKQVTLGIGQLGEQIAGSGLSTFEGSVPPNEAPTGLRRNPYLQDLRRGLAARVVSAHDDGDAGAPSPMPPAPTGGSATPHAGPATHTVFHDDPYLCWLFGLVAKKCGEPDLARQALCAAVCLAPLLWAAWQDLASLVVDESQLLAVCGALSAACSAFPWVLTAFRVLVRKQHNHFTAALADVDELAALAPTAPFVLQMRATLHTQERHYDVARDGFALLTRLHPARLDGLDDFSNVLFVLGDRRGLTNLAQHAFDVDAYSAESNCIAGNLYALMRRHDQSLLHFRRAVTINPRCISAWTLLGHEYLEVKNTAAATEAYRTAVALDEKDHRAWYGLGQIYELLMLHQYALHYYRKTTMLRPDDSRMWIAVAGCLEKMQQVPQAVACLERAEAYEQPTDDGYCSLVLRIARHMQRTDPAKAARQYEKVLVAPKRRNEDVLDAQVYLVSYLCATADDLMGAPARAPSFDPIMHRGSLGNTAASSMGRTQPRPSADQRRHLARDYVDRADALLAELSEALGSEAPPVLNGRNAVALSRAYIDSHH